MCTLHGIIHQLEKLSNSPGAQLLPGADRAETDGLEPRGHVDNAGQAHISVADRLQPVPAFIQTIWITHFGMHQSQTMGHVAAIS